MLGRCTVCYGGVLCGRVVYRVLGQYTGWVVYRVLGQHTGC